MPLPAPNLDDRRFQQLVDEAKRMVQQRCPEWSDHNVSDPGVTLIETFAYMVDQLIYRLNRVPDKHYVKFLELIGLHLFPPAAARATVTFWLSAPQAATVSVPAGTEVTTARSETEEAVGFTVADELAIVPCSAQALLTSSAGAPERVEDRSATLDGAGGFACFGAPPAPGDAFYVGLSEAVPSCVVALRVSCRIEGVGVDPRNPPLRWEAWDGEAWVPCELDRDDTGGLNRAGDIVLHVPASHRAGVVAERRAGWLRAIVTPTEEGQPAYSSPPRVDRLSAFTIGGNATALNAVAVRGEVLGSSEHVPGQEFTVGRPPVVPGGGPAVVEVSGPAGWERWTEVPTFADSGPEDRHFFFDRHGGRVVFGPAVRLPDGGVAQHGAVPPHGAGIRIPLYLTGGGRRGNVARGAISILRTPIPFVARVENRRPAANGVDAETMEEAKLRGPILLRTRNRAVTAEDFEQLAREAAPEVARVRCLPAGAVDGGTGPGGASSEQGVRVLVVPAVEADEEGRLRLEQLRPDEATVSAIAAYLDERRLVGCRVAVEPPTYQGITVVARLRARPAFPPGALTRAATEALYRYFDPVNGGPDGGGWPFGRPVHVGEVYAVLQRVEGVGVIEDARLFPADPITGERTDAVQRLEVGPGSLVFSFEHLVRVEGDTGPGTP